jgi:two-component system sensor histidine kinase KdpD
MAAGLRADWIAVNVEAPSKVKPSESDLRALAEHLRLAESLGAETATLSGHKASEEILSYSRDRNITKIIIGKPTHPRWKDKLFGSMLDELVRGSGDIDVYVIRGDTGEPAPRLALRQARYRPNAKEWMFSLGSAVVCTAVSALAQPYLTLVDIAMVYLLGIVVASSRTGKRPALAATILGIAAYDYFFVPPRYTFAVSDVRYLFTFVVMFVTAFTISRLTLRVREQANAARQRERRTAALFSLSRKLVRERGIEKLSALAIKHIGELFSAHVVVLVPDEKGNLVVPVTGPDTFALDHKEMSVAQWAFDHRQAAGLGTNTLSGAKALYLPLAAPSRTVGLIGVLPGPHSFLDHEQVHVLESFANQIAMAIERATLAEETQRALLKAETETLRNTLLSSVSHDLRTPLAAITGAATALLQEDVALDAAAGRELTQTIREEAEHLNQIIRNVLDMTRLEAGAITVRKEWQSIEEIVGAVLSRLSEKLKERALTTNLSEDLPLVAFDPLLIEQVLMNLLNNVLKYTPEGTPIELSAHIRDGAVALEILDRGPGIHPGDEKRIFEKFFRGSAAGGGIGLGLTICDAIVGAHGGRIWAENRPGGGTVVRFTLPLGEEPPFTEKEQDE